MPLRPGRSRKTVSQNIRELHTGKTYARTKATKGKARADKQAVAIALNNARRSGKKPAARKTAAPKSARSRARGR
jgi:hypothetical protein